MTPYTDAKPLLKAAMEGDAAALRGDSPPHNPYAAYGVRPGEEDDMPEAAAWFFGFWDVMYDRSGLERKLAHEESPDLRPSLER